MYKGIKKAVDYSLAAASLVATVPIALPVMVALAIQNKGDVFFSQKRLGKNGKVFNIFKMQTMLNTKDENGVLLPESERMTKLGSTIRKSGLDELPQLINIIKGDMSFVGPRPVCLDVISEERYKDDPKIQQRYAVKPGFFHPNLATITKEMLPLDERVERDIEYIKKQSFAEDAKLVCYGLSEISMLKHDKYNLKVIAMAKGSQL